MKLDDTCIFCKMIKKEIPAKIAFENEQFLAFHDINPVAKTHILIIPKFHIEGFDQFDEKSAELLAGFPIVIKQLVSDLALENGYRVVLNRGEDGLQTVPHLHFHLIAGRKMTWPPG